MKKPLTIKKNSSIPTVLISGGAGFVGSHLAESMLEKKARVIVLDNFKTGKDSFVSHLVTNPNFALYDCDINLGLPKDIESVDYIFHLAGLEEYLYSKDFLDLDALLTNSIGTKNLLDLAKASDAKFLLTSTIDVYQGRLSQLTLNNYFGFTQLEDNKYSLTEAKRFAEAIVWEYFKKYSIDVRIVRLPEIFGPRMSLEASGFMGSLMRNLVEHKDLTIKGEGNAKDYYLYITDAIAGIIKAQFNDATKGNIYSLVETAPVSALELAYIFKGLAEGAVEINFSADPKATVNAVPETRVPDNFNLGDLAWEPRVPIKEGITNTLKWLGYETNENSFKPAKLILQQQNVSKPASASAPVPISASVSAVSAPIFTPAPVVQVALPPVSMPKASKKHLAWTISAGFAVLFAALGIFVGLPCVQTYLSVKSGVSKLESIKKQATSMSFGDVSTSALAASKDFENARNSFYNLRWLFTVKGSTEQYHTIYNLLGSLAYFSKASSEIATAAEPLSSLWEVIRPDKSKELDPAMFSNAKLNISNAKDYLAFAQANFNSVNSSLIPKTYKTELETYGNYLGILSTSLDTATLFMKSVPDILGVGGQKKYLIWFQNSNELRPTGGFIGSYGVLTFENGKLKDLVIDDIYNPDGQIDVKKISVAPPAPIATALNEKVSYLRNSNWNPDFPKATADFANLYYRITGEKADGYIAVDLKVVSNLLRVTGPIFLIAYNEEITADNLYERAQFHSDFSYTDGSSQKRSFLTVLGNKLLEKLFNMPKENAGVLLTEIIKSLNERDMLVYFANSPLNTYLHDQHWDGSLVSTPGDYLYVVNSNLGGTKANYFVKNTMDYAVTSMTRDGVLRGTLALTYKHTATSDAWPGGPYTNYVRVLTQNGSKLTGATLIANDGTSTDIFKSIIISKEGSYTSFDYQLKILTGQTQKLVLNYDLPPALNITKDYKEYSLYWQKQPGTTDDLYSVKMSHPFGMVVVDRSQDLAYADGVVQSSGKLVIDKNYFIRLK